MGFDPSGNFFSIAGFSASIGTQGQLRGTNTANAIRMQGRVVHKVMKLANRLNNLYADARDFYDLLNFDMGDIQEIAGSLGGAQSLLLTIVRPRSFEIPLPKGTLRKAQSLGGRIDAMFGRNKAQEIMGELATALMIQGLGFKHPDTRWFWSTSQGPDQVAKHSSGLWGIFEAKGGNSRLGVGQMRGP